MRRKDYEERFHGAFAAKAPAPELSLSRMWAERSPRACVAQWKRIHSECAKFDSKMRVVKAREWTGDPSNASLFRVATAIYNGVAGIAQAYDILRNPKYNVGAAFTYSSQYVYLSTKTNLLVPKHVFSSSNSPVDPSAATPAISASQDEIPAQGRSMETAPIKALMCCAWQQNGNISNSLSLRLLRAIASKLFHGR